MLGPDGNLRPKGMIVAYLQQEEGVQFKVKAASGPPEHKAPGDQFPCFWTTGRTPVRCGLPYSIDATEPSRLEYLGLTVLAVPF